MCTICKKFKKGTISVEEAWDELEEQSVYLNEDHIDEVEALLNDDVEDVYDYLKDRKSLEDDDELYDEDDIIDYDDDLE